MRRAPRYLALDDGPFTFQDTETALVGVLTRGAQTIEAVATSTVQVDGDDATDRALGLARRLPGSGPDILLIDGIAFGGFNIIDLDALHEALDRPVIALTRHPPDRARMEAALRAHFSDAERRIALLPPTPPIATDVLGRTLHVHARGAPPDRIPALLGPAMAESGIPEPLRIAHLIAAAITRGASGSKA